MTGVAWLRESACRTRIQTAAIGLALVHLITGAGAHSAYAWPDKTVKLITPGAAGSHTDAMARVLAKGLGNRWGHPVIVENQPGADGILAVRSFLNVTNGHALLYSFNSIFTVNPALHEKLPYSPKTDLVPISHVVEDFIAIVASPGLKISTLAELQTAMRANPGSLNYASFPGSPYLAFQAFQERVGAEIAFVPYRALTSAIPDLMENRIQVGVLSLAMVGELAQSGKLKILALASSGRAPSAPDIPSAAELGFPELVVVGGHGLFARTTMQPELREQVLRDVRDVLNEPEAAARITKMGFVVRATGPSEFSAFLDRETERVVMLVRRLGPEAWPRNAP